MPDFWSGLTPAQMAAIDQAHDAELLNPWNYWLIAVVILLILWCRPGNWLK